MLEYKTSVQQVEKVIETPGSRPVIVTDEQLDDYACKYDFTEKLIKEYLAHHFLKIWELPVIPAAFVKVLSEHINPAILKKGIITSRTQPRHFNKLCFGTLYNVDAILLTNHFEGLRSDYSQLKKYQNREDFLKIALFDLWVVNIDRLHGNYNILIQPINGEYILTPIDHSDIFDGFDIGDSLSQLTPESSILTSAMALVLLYGNRKIESQANALLNNFPNFVNECGKILPKLVEGCPDSWCLDKPKLLQNLQKFVYDEGWIKDTVQNFKGLVQHHLIR